MSAPTADRALGELLRVLACRHYRFVTPTPATHARVVSRTERAEARSLADVLGWSLPFSPGAVDPEVVELLEAAGELVTGANDLLRSKLRVSSLGPHLYLHSSYPTNSPDAVFFGPDSYRFANLLNRELGKDTTSIRRIADIGTGAGVGAITAAERCRGARIFATDVNPQALRLARINARAAGCGIDMVLGSKFEAVDGKFDLIIANPPYIADRAERDYRDGGGMHGGAFSLELAREGIGRLAPGGRLILYGGTAIVDGFDALGAALANEAERRGCHLAYDQIDPDVFGEELDQPLYRTVDRIAVIEAIFTTPA